LWCEVVSAKSSTHFWSLPALIFGSYLLVCWVRIHTADRMAFLTPSEA